MWKTSVVTAPETAIHAPAPLKGSLEDTIGRAAAIGFDAVQFTINRPSEFDLETDFHGPVLEAGGLVAQVDISDVDRRPPDGKGFDFPKLIDALKRIDFRDYLVFEFRANGTGIAESTAGLQYIRSL
jgi:sugar phosphate isomerase/epimerase